jgi:hypothetical protein
VEQLGERDFSDATPSSRARLAAIMESLRRGESVGMAWTIYPEDEPVTLVINRTGILLPDGRLAILSEARPLGTDALPATVQRDLEALNQTDSQISIHRLDGTAVMRNPAAVVAFGPVNENASLDDLAIQVGGAETADLLRTSIAAHKMYATRVRGRRWRGGRRSRRTGARVRARTGPRARAGPPAGSRGRDWRSAAAPGDGKAIADDHRAKRPAC